MAGLLYYLPATMKQSPESFLQERLGFTGAIKHRGVAGKGPDSGAGVIFAIDATAPKPLGYFSDRQTWEKAPAQDWYIGRMNDEPPTPAELARTEFHPGHIVRLNDGNDWIAPVVRLASGDINLPSALKLNDEGALTPKPLARYEAIIAVASEVWKDMERLAQGEDTSSIETDFDYGIQALALNYHLAAEEVSFLELLTNTLVGQIVLALIDWPTVIMLTKELDEKKVDAGASG